MSKAELNAVEIEFACTILPIKPKAIMIRTEKMVASDLLPKPCVM